MRKCIYLFLLILVFLFFPIDGQANEVSLDLSSNEALQEKIEVGQENKQEEMEEDILGRIDFSAIDSNIGDVQDQMGVGFKDIVEKLMKGELSLSKEVIGNLLLQPITSEWAEYRKEFSYLIMLVLISAIFYNFSSVFKNTQIGEISFFIVYLLLFTQLLLRFGALTGIVTQALESIISFMKTLIPAYFLTVACSTGTTTALLFYNITFVVITGVQWILLYLVIPAIHIYLVLSLVNHLSKEEFLSRMTQLIKKGIDWILKTMLGAVIGIHVVQGLIAPAIDEVKSMAVTKTASAIPGVGNAINAVTEVLLASAVLIKNSVGVAALICLLFLCAAPVVKLAFHSFLYKVITAILQPVSQKQMLECLNNMGESIGMLLKVLSMTVVLFFVTIAIIAVSTNR